MNNTENKCKKMLLKWIGFVLIMCFSTVYAQTPNWSVNPSAYEHSMTLTAVVLDENQEYAAEEVLIGIFDGDECVGLSTTDTYFPPIEANLAFVLIYGNAASATYSVQVFMNDVIYEAGTVNFSSNAVEGTLDEPYEIQPIFEVSGCMDPNAINYNAQAIEDDGSCIYPIYGCTDPVAFNYNPNANTDDGSCIEVVIGCMDENYLEYNPEANSGFQDVLCLTLVISGCTDPMYFEYNPDANIDDGSCSITWQDAYDIQTESLSEVLSYNIELIDMVADLEVELENCNSSSITIDIVEGWNLIGFIGDEALNAELAFESIIEEIIVVKNNLGEVYYPQYGFNGIGNLIPGQGYQMKTHQAIPEFQF